VEYSIEEISRLSGKASAIYAVHLAGEDRNEFYRFIEEHKNNYTEELKDIVTRLELMGKKNGARQVYFKEAEGLPGDLVCALYDLEDSKLRLYCMRLGSCTLILGGGGTKPKTIRSWQQKPDLKAAAELMIRVSKDIYQRQKDKEIKLDPVTNRFTGNLKFGNNEIE